MKRFSIIIPAHNSSAYIHNALESVRIQSFKDYELIVVCDSCDDNTEQIAKSYGAITKSVNYHQDGQTRNTGIELATGEYVLFIDDDDWWLHEFVLEQLDEKLKEDNPDVLCFSFIFRHWKYATPKGNNGKRWIAVWNKCWRREFIKDCRFSNEWSVSDVQFDKQAMSKKPKLIEWDMPIYYYNYMREGSISHFDKENKKR